ncbi:MAG: NADH-quinone oxidoreductase subunit A [Pirellulales bacterium]|nr:NADH-quinone oxidoreductase subunit A [Pirellulales bacterium]
MISTSIVAYLTLFLGASFAFLFAALLVGWFLRARAPNPVKKEIYECGEAPIGSSQVRFDLRFYVVALVFLVFDVEVAFLFPWATVFGDATRLMDPGAAAAVTADGAVALSATAQDDLRSLGVARPELPLPGGTVAVNRARLAQDGRLLAMTAMADVAVFFGVLLVGFVYVWYRGDLDWVRAMGRPAPGLRQG